MQNIFSRLARFIPVSMAALLLGGALSVSVPAFVPVAHAVESITADDLLPSEFSDNVGLGQGDLRETIGKVIQVALSFLGIVAVCIVLWGGMRWMTAGGSEEKVKEAQKIMVAGLIGLAIILSAWAITSFVVTQLVSATTE
jgi:hypothetical protein